TLHRDDFLMEVAEVLQVTQPRLSGASRPDRPSATARRGTGLSEAQRASSSPSAAAQPDLSELLLPHFLIRGFSSTGCPLSSGQRQQTALMPPFPPAPSQLVAQQLGVASVSPPCHRCAKGAADNDNQNQDPPRQRSHQRQHLSRPYADPADGRKGVSTNVERSPLGGPARLASPLGAPLAR